MSAAETKRALRLAAELRRTPKEDADRLIGRLTKALKRPPSDALLEAMAQHLEVLSATLRARVVERRERSGESVKACLICRCDEARSCAITEHERCRWSARVAPVCSRCASNIDRLLERVGAAPCTVLQLLLPLIGCAREEAEQAIDYLLELGELELVGDVLHVARPTPPFQHLGAVEDCEVWSPGSFVVGQGWSPLQGPLAAAVTSVAVPIDASPKEPS